MIEAQRSDSRRNATIIHATPVWLPRTQMWMYNQARFLPAEIDLHVVCEKTQNLDVFGLPNLHCLADEPRRRQWIDRGLRKLKVRRHLDFLVDTAQTTGAEIIHSHFCMQAWNNLEAARKADIRHVVSVYGADVTQAPRSDPSNLDRYRRLFDQIDGVFCEGRVMAESVAQLGCPREKLVIHHLGVDLDLLPFRPRTWTPGTPLRVLIAATFREKKGIPYAIRALGELGDRVDLEITIIGDATGKAGDREEKARILSEIETNSLSERTTLMGFQSHAVLIEEAYRHHIFLSPSVSAADGDTEGGVPVSIIEMAASGMPVVSSLHCDIPEVVISGETGWLAPERDWKALASHLDWLISHPDEWESYLAAGRQHIEREYDGRTQGHRLAGHYLRLTTEAEPLPLRRRNG